MKIGFVIACHEKIDDLMIHLEALKYYSFKHHIIIIHSMDYSADYMNEIKKHTHKRIDGYGHYIGPLLCAIHGVREAHKLGLDYICYNNADDIVYNDEFVENNFNNMQSNACLCGGYNWLNVGVFHDITLNQLYLHVPSFNKTADDAEAYFKKSMIDYLCEYKIPRWLKRTCTDIKKQFYRVPGREQEPGIGWERKDIYGAFLAKGLTVPIGFWDKLENNNRFFNLEWQMIGSHDIGQRMLYWRKIRSLIPHGKEMEKEKHFARFVDAARNNKPWNLKTTPEPKKEQTNKEPKLMYPNII